ncbi:MAG: hypothetical protein AB1503_12740 [Bacillota bacterium]
MAVIAYDHETWWGYFDYMPAAFFARLGFEAIDRDGPRLLMYHPAAPDSLPSHQGSTAGLSVPARIHRAGSITKDAPSLIKPRRELSLVELSLPEGGEPGTVDVRVLLHSRCPAAVLVRHTLEAGVGRYPGVRLECVDTRDRATMRWYGIANGVYVDGRLLIRKVPSPPEIATLLHRAGAIRSTSECQTPEARS